MTASQVIKRCFWISCTLTLTTIIVGCIYLFLSQQRAILAINELKKSKLAELESVNNSVSVQERKLRYILAWFRTKNSLLTVTDTHWIEATANVFSQLIKHQAVKAPELTSQCSNCSAEVYKNILLAQQKISELELSARRLDYLSELSARLKVEIAQKIKLHQILAKDFERLVGSPSAYNNNLSSEQILYFISGTFKWLPLLDTSKVDKSLQTTEISNFSAKIESLRIQSNSIIDDYSALKDRNNNSIEEQTRLQKHADNLNINLSLQLISVWEFYLPLFSK